MNINPGTVGLMVPLIADSILRLSCLIQQSDFPEIEAAIGQLNCDWDERTAPIIAQTLRAIMDERIREDQHLDEIRNRRKGHDQ